MFMLRTFLTKKNKQEEKNAIEQHSIHVEIEWFLRLQSTYITYICVKCSIPNVELLFRGAFIGVRDHPHIRITSIVYVVLRVHVYIELLTLIRL